MTDPIALPPFSGDDPTCIKCGHRGATTIHRTAGEPHAGEIAFVARAGRYPERLERCCWRCDWIWDEATVTTEEPK